MVCVFLCAMQANNSTNTTEDAEVDDAVAFPYDLYNAASAASVSHQLSICLRKTPAVNEKRVKDMTWLSLL